MELAQHTDRPELTVEIGGQSYDFGEILIGQRADLEAWIAKNIPHPLQALKGVLDGLPKEVAAQVAENARQEAKDWPPKIGTSAGSAALLSKEPGQILALYVGLQKFHPGTTAEQADRLYRQLSKELARASRKFRGNIPETEQTVKRIFSVMFGMGDSVDESPKAQREPDGAEMTSRFPGTISIGDANGNCA